MPNCGTHELKLNDPLVCTACEVNPGCRVEEGGLTIHAGGRSSGRPGDLPREAGALHGLGSLLNLILVAAAVGRDDLTRAGFDVHCETDRHPCVAASVIFPF